MVNTLTLALVGCGAMGSALLKGWLTLNDSKSRFTTIWVIAPHREKVEPFLSDARVHWLPSPEALPATPDVIVFAVKPRALEEILPLYNSFASVMVSVASGKPLSFYESLLPAAPLIIRAMPNTPVDIHKGVIALYPNGKMNSIQRDMINACFGSLGFCLWVHSDEEINKVTALSGSGPAYVFYLIEALAQSAESLGFPKDTAMNLALYTFWGASSYAHDSSRSLKELREAVTSPQGTTAAALKVFETKDLHHIIETAVKAAYARAKELGS